MTESVLDFFAKDGTQDLVRRLREAGVNMRYNGPKKTDRLAGKTLVVTGTLPTLSRTQGGSAHHTERRQGVVVRL